MTHNACHHTNKTVVDITPNKNINIFKVIFGIVEYNIGVTYFQWTTSCLLYDMYIH